jgi:protein-S-isoprenylcysteine O-methyltransferase Ste14
MRRRRRRRGIGIWRFSRSFCLRRSSRCSFRSRSLLHSDIPVTIYVYDVFGIRTDFDTGVSMMGYHPYIQMLAVGMFSTGLAMETLADLQLDQYKAEGGRGILREGVWSIVRNPKYVSPALFTSTSLTRPS